jgi:hypothetical protein
MLKGERRRSPAMPTGGREVEQFLARELRGWVGLAPDCDADEALDGLTTTAHPAGVRLGTDDVAYETLTLLATGMNEPVTVYVRHGVLALLRTEYWSFDAFECAALLEALGDPSDRSELVWRERRVPDAEWLYAERGLALGVLPETSLIVTASGFAPTTADDYLANLARVRPERGVAAPAG